MSNQTLPPFDPSLGLIFTAADHLIPLFRSGSIDTTLARQMSLSAIDAYNPESRADYVNVARTIAFSMAALALLGHAAEQDITMTEKMRVLSRATALNQSADQTERTMMQRRRYHRASPPNEQTAAPHRQIDDAEVQAAVAEAMKEYLAIRPTTADAAPKHASRARSPEVRSTSGMDRPLDQTDLEHDRPGPDLSCSNPIPAAPRTAPPDPQAATPASAIHRAGTRPDAIPHPTAPYRQQLLNRSAMQRVMNQNGTDTQFSRPMASTRPGRESPS